MRIFVSIFLLWSLAAMPATAQQLHVVASFSILADITHEIAGDHAQIDVLAPADTDIHAFAPAPSDVRKIAGADIFIVNGLGLEGWMQRLTQAADFKGALVTASTGITPILVQGVPDPHSWQSPANGKIYAANIRDALMLADPANAQQYRSSAERYLAKLDALDASIKTQMDAIPAAARRAVIAHNALRYFADRYNVELIAPLGLSTEGDIAAGDMARIIDVIRREHIHAVFVENISDPRLVRQLGQDSGAILGGTLYSDALSKPAGPAPTYIALFEHNTKTLVGALASH